MITLENLENRRRFPPGQLEKHRGDLVAFRPNGSGIVASAADLAELEGKLHSLGTNPSQVVFEHVPTGIWPTGRSLVDPGADDTFSGYSASKG